MRTRQIIAGLVLLAGVGFAAFFYYSWMWSERLLAPVHAGMTQSQVQSLVGSPPRKRSDATGETWDYTRSWSRDARVYFTNGFVWAVETD
jgi:outer membrane protein assembly factor BamE (lipoprotein component of BamABCDE complex)